jgi:N-acetylglucosaminyldiphosphoundecaprenol N-acetyl-beta-D-mannosaminyltransferase
LVAIHLLTPPAFLAAVSADVQSRQPIVYTGIYAALFRYAMTDRGYRDTLTRTRNYPDGAGVVWALKVRGYRAERTPTTDLIYDILALADQHGWKLALYGATDEVLGVVLDKLKANYPNCEVVFAANGFEEIDPRRIAETRPDLTLVARGPGRQERWALSAQPFYRELESGPILTCGGLFDYISGKSKRAPRWLQRLGLEWAYRSFREPRRLLMRYLVGNTWFFVNYLVLRRPITVLEEDPGARSSTPSAPRNDAMTP